MTPLLHPAARATTILLLTLAMICPSACRPGLAGETGNSADSLPAAALRADSVRHDSLARARQDSINRAQPGYVIDSILPVEEELRRFRAAIGGAPVTHFHGGSDSRDALVRRFVAALAARDTAEFRAMVLSAREFADLVYPSSPYTHAPFRQAPGLVWMRIANPSVSGFKRLIRRRGGVAYRYVDHMCGSAPETQGRNLLWGPCTLRVVTPQGDTITQRWFGSIVERDGRFKFVSYTNQF